MTGPPRLTAALGSCCGFEVHSTLPFLTLRRGAGTPLHVAEETGLAPTGDVLAEWLPRRDHPFHGRLLRDGDEYAFWASDAGWFVVNPQTPSIHVEPSADALQRELRLLGVPTALCVVERGDTSIHAAAVEIAGHAVLLAGPSGYGKTTLAAAFAREGHRLLTEDTSTCTTRHGPAVFPGPAAVRLRIDVAADLAQPGSTIEHDRVDRIWTVLDPVTRGDGEPVPLRAILFLREFANGPELVPVSVANAIRDVWALTFMLPNDASRAACFERVTDLVSRVQTFDLRRPKAIDQLPAVIDLVERRIATG